MNRGKRPLKKRPVRGAGSDQGGANKTSAGKASAGRAAGGRRAGAAAEGRTPRRARGAAAASSTFDDRDERRGRRPVKAQPTREPSPGEEPSARTPFPKLPSALSQMSAEPHPGQWLLTTREGSEQDLVDELMLGKVIDPAPRVLAPGLVLAPKIPKREKRPVELTFARQGFEILISSRAQGLEELAQRLERSLRHRLAQVPSYALHVWVPDSSEGNPLSALAEQLEERLAQGLAAQLPELKRVDDASLRRLPTVPFAQVCLAQSDWALAGVMHSNATPSRARGGRTRVRINGEFTSRAARKLEEALAWLGVEPGPGELCVDLGAAPGGWTYMLAERRARVIAVDPAKLRADIAARKGVRHVQESAFTFTPDEPVDWLFCDMAYRPLEAAALLAKWGRRRWARMIVANVKLPMKKKAEILARVRSILEVEGEWKGLRTKQLYHDRDEITLTAHTA